MIPFFNVILSVAKNLNNYEKYAKVFNEIHDIYYKKLTESFFCRPEERTAASKLGERIPPK